MNQYENTFQELVKRADLLALEDPRQEPQSKLEQQLENDGIKKKMGRVWLKKVLRKRFWERVKIREENECWPWQKSLFHFGHGQANYLRVEMAHRIAYLLYYGIFDEKLCVLHQCDNPPCCNPRHLFLGTSADNMKDMYAKQRRKPAKGKDHYLTKLTDENVIEIRRLSKSDFTF